MPDLYLESFLVLGTGFFADAVLCDTKGSLLEPFLEGRLAVRAVEGVNVAIQSRLQQGALEECDGSAEAAVEIDRADDGLVGVG